MLWRELQTSRSLSGRRWVASCSLATAMRVGRHRRCRVAELVANDLVRLQQVGQRGRHIAHLVADGLGEPAVEPLIGGDVAAHLDLDGLGQQGGAQGAFLGQAQQPVDADLPVESKRGQGVGARQALVAGGQELGEGRAIEPDAPGQAPPGSARPGPWPRSAGPGTSAADRADPACHSCCILSPESSDRQHIAAFGEHMPLALTHR